MKVVCVSNQRLDLNIKTQTVYTCPETDLRIGKEYVVYGLYQSQTSIYFCIASIATLSFPIWYTYDFFQIIDPSISKYWIGLIKTFRDNSNGLFFSFPEWVNEEGFNDFLTEGSEREISIYKSYKIRMDLEFPDTSIKEAALVADANWLICPTCIDAWENSDAVNAMIICPKCQKMFHNPRYKENFPQL